MHFADRLQAAVQAKGAPVCAGLDPRVDLIPTEFFDRAFADHGRTPAAICAAVRAFCEQALEIVAPFVPAVKPQAAFFETLGAGGWEAFAAVCAKARELDLLVIADVKRGDIGSTAEAYAGGLFGESRAQGVTLPSIGADAITVNPYLGGDGVLPFVKRARECHGGVFVLARTSNPGSAEFQLQELSRGGTLVDEVAARINAWGEDSLGACGFSDVGAVVGATHADSASHLRKLLPHTLFLAPGWGAQGGEAATVRACFTAEGTGALVNSSRGVTHAYAAGPLKDYGFGRWREAVEIAARTFRDEIKALTTEPA